MKFQTVALCVCLSAVSAAQLRVGTWNVTNYSSGRVSAFQTSIYGEFQGRKFAPDVFIGQEFLSQAGVTAFLSILNTAPNSPGDWAAATFIDGPDTDSAFFYRTSKVTFLGQVIAAAGSSGTSGQPRNTMRYDFRLKGYSSERATISAYSVHLKSGTASTDLSRRLLEVNNIISNANALPSGRSRMVAGDLNIQNASQTAYQTLTRSVNNFGPFIDPIASPGSWDNNNAYRFIHTQDPVGQMDSRYDQILLSPDLVDGVGMDYIGVQNLVYSTTTWNDPNHSYRCWGNDGSSYNVPMTVTGNTMVGSVIAQALVDATPANGHLPVFLDIKAPAKMRLSETSIDFGKMVVGETVSVPLDVYDDGDRVLWGANGIAALTHNVTVPTGVVRDGGRRILFARGKPIRYQISYTATSAGAKSGTVTVTSNDPDQLTVSLPYTASVR
jgi:hypothetical protein